ncbi:MAG: ATP-grasp domain-containing protein [Planctomycetia bacterium]
MPASNCDAPAAPPVVMLGASVRAFAASAVRAGWAVHAADLFCDADLATVAASCRRVSDYPAGLFAAANDVPAGPWCYTGAIENHPDLIERIATTRPLAGNAAAVVRRVRDPAMLRTALADAGLRFPATFLTAEDVPTDGSFIMKPRSSAGGHGIVRWTRGLAEDRGPGTATLLWQRWVDGLPMAAAYCLGKETATLMGTSRQLLGAAWCHAAPHAYCGSVAVPLADLGDRVRDELHRLGHLLGEAFGLVGAVGVDFIHGADDRITVIEVNPRLTASMELVERATGLSIAGAHFAACGYPPPKASSAGAAPGIWSKAILFARENLTIDAPLLDRLHRLAVPWTQQDGWPAIADIPQPGQTLARGRPVVTIFARGETIEDSSARLVARLGACE